MRDRLLIVAVIGFLAGICARSYVFVSIPLVGFICLLGVVLLVSYFIFYTRMRILFASLFLIFLSVGVVRFHISDTPLYTSDLFQNVDSLVAVDGKVVTDVDTKEKTSDFVLKVGNDKILVKDEVFSKVEYGDMVHVEGILKLPENFLGDNGKAFDYVNYLRKDGIVYIVENGNITIQESNGGFFLKRWLYSFKHFLMRTIDKLFTMPESGLLSGVLLGTKSSLGNDLREEFIQTGTIHIVALSGYNVTIIAEAVMALFTRVFPFYAGIAGGAVGIILFALMTGAGSTVVRAAIMAIMVLVAKALGRAADIGRALVFTAVVMILFNPWILVYDISFQLSFLATVGLVYLTPKVEPYLKRIPAKFGFRTIIASTIATTIFVMPFIAYTMGNFSLVAIPANLLILPLMPLVMLVGTISLAVGALSSFIAFPITFISYALLHYVLAVIHFFAKLPFASKTISHVPLLVVGIVYALLLYYMFKK
jgi:competence protein ComEC